MFRRTPFRFLLPLLILVSAFIMVVPQVALAECGVYHTVTAGQNLFRISLRYGVSMYDIAAANHIADIRLIYTGQSLYIPCAGTSGTTGQGVTTPAAPVYTYPNLPSYPTYPTYYPSAPTTGFPNPSNVVTAPIFQTVNCTGFRATSPLDGLPDGQTTFFWDAPASINDIAIYQVIVLDDRGARVAAFSAAGGFTNITGDVGFNAIGGRSRFSWYVVALVNGNEACRTQVTTLNRVWNPNAGLSS